MAEIVGRAEELQIPAIGEAAASEIHAPHLVDAGRQGQRRAFGRLHKHLPAFACHKVCVVLQPVSALVFDANEVRSQQVAHAPIPALTECSGPFRDLAWHTLRRQRASAGLEPMSNTLKPIAGPPGEGAASRSFATPKPVFVATCHRLRKKGYDSEAF